MVPVLKQHSGHAPGALQAFPPFETSAADPFALQLPRASFLPRSLSACGPFFHDNLLSEQFLDAEDPCGSTRTQGTTLSTRASPSQMSECTPFEELRSSLPALAPLPAHQAIQVPPRLPPPKLLPLQAERIDQG